MMRSLAPVALLAAAVPFCADEGAPSRHRAAADTPPPGVLQILPRGGIPAIFAPRFVPAAEARIPDDAWVLGVVVEGEAKAYSLNLLNRHEVVNDQSGGTAFAAVW
jgi:hypothetical protein